MVEKIPRRLATTVFLAAVALMAAVVLQSFWPWFQKERAAAHFEANAKRLLKPDELQRWATNLIYRRPPGRVALAAAQIDPGDALLKLYPGEPLIYIDGPEDVSQRYVQVIWGGGLIGDFGFHIGGTNLEAPFGEEWTPGVFFLKRR